MSWPDTSQLIFMSLWRATWQGSIAVLCGLAFVRLTNRLPSSVHCWIWRIVCAKMLLALVWLGQVEVRLLPAAMDATVARALPATPLPWQPAASSAATAPARPVPALDPAKESGDTGRNVSFLRHVQSLLVLLWAAGVAVHVVALYRARRRIRQLQSTAIPIDGEPLTRLVRQISLDAGLAASPRCKSISSGLGPMVIGTLRPVVLLPSSIAEQLEPDQLRLLLKHEIAHIHRRDLRWNWLTTATHVLFFFNPLTWVLLRELRLAQEMACDAYAANESRNVAANYARLLMQIALSKKSARQRVFVTGILESFGTVKRRIEKMQYLGQKPRRGRALVAGVMLCGVCIGLVPFELVPAQSTTAEATTDETLRAKARSGRYEVAVVDVADVPRGTYRTVRSPRIPEQLPRIVGDKNSGGFSGGGSGTITVPTFALALRVSPLKRETLVTATGTAIAIDGEGQQHESSTSAGPRRVAVPTFELDHPGCAGLYFGFEDRPEALKSLKGSLLLTPIQTIEAKFSYRDIEPGARKKTKLGLIEITTLEEDEEGLTIGLVTPTPARQRPPRNVRDPRAMLEFRRRQRAMQPMVTVAIVDTRGDFHMPVAESGGGQSSGGSSVAPGITGTDGGAGGGRSAGGSVRGFRSGRAGAGDGFGNNTGVARGPSRGRQCQFAPLPDGTELDYLLVRVIVPKGEPKRLRYELKDIRLD